LIFLEDKGMKRIDGRHRVFIVVAGLWTLVSIYNGLLLYIMFDEEGYSVWFSAVAILVAWILPIGLMYGIIWVIVWVINGFRKEKQEDKNYD
jgi:hypothetical protein